MLVSVAPGQVREMRGGCPVIMPGYGRLTLAGPQGRQEGGLHDPRGTGKAFTWQERHRRLAARLLIASGLTLVVLAIGSVLIWAFESGVKPWFRRIKGVQGHADRRPAVQRPEDSAKTENSLVTRFRQILGFKQHICKDQLGEIEGFALAAVGR
jgi:hypothetical protein